MSSLVTSTPVNTPQELRAISSLKVGDHVTAYDPATGKASVQTVQQTMVHHDANLLSVTLRTLTPAAPTTSSAAAATSKQQDGAVAAHGAHAPPQASASADETIQTTTNHPWLTADHGWILASFLRLGEPVRRVDGSVALVVAVQAESGAAAMWDLTVSTVHTFAVGSGAYVAHNCGFNELADAYAEELATKVTPKPFMRRWATIGVGYVEEADGTVTRVVGLSNGASSTMERTLRASLDGADTYLERNLSRGAAVHAEDYIMEYAQGEGRSLRGIGASNDFCEACSGKIR